MGDGIEAYRTGEPRSRCYIREIYLAHANGDDVTHDNARNDRHQLHQSLAEGKYQDGGDKRCEGEKPVGLSHIHSAARKGKTDKDDGGSDDYRRENPIQQFLALPFYQGAHDEIHQRDAGKSGDGSRQSPLLGGCDDWGDEGEGAAQEDRHLALGDEVKEKGSHTCG